MWKKFAINAKCAITFGTDLNQFDDGHKLPIYSNVPYHLFLQLSTCHIPPHPLYPSVRTLGKIDDFSMKYI